MQMIDNVYRHILTWIIYHQQPKWSCLLSESQNDSAQARTLFIGHRDLCATNAMLSSRQYRIVHQLRAVYLDVRGIDYSLNYACSVRRQFNGRGGFLNDSS